MAKEIDENFIQKAVALQYDIEKTALQLLQQRTRNNCIKYYKIAKDNNIPIQKKMKI